jgi:predicted DsbA family dithiol-disulfide isomerase
MPGVVGNLGQTEMNEPVTIDVYSDVVCPWCYIGKRKLEIALARLAAQNIAVTPNWRAFQLNPDMPATGMARKDYVDTKFGGPERATQIYARVAAVGNEVGIPFEFEKIQRQPNTINAHRLIRYAGELGQQDAVAEALFKAFFLEYRDIGDIAILSDIAAGAGLAREDVFDYLSSNQGTEPVQQEDAVARQLGITGVPFFVFGGKYAVSGAQDADVLVQAYQQAAQEVVASSGVA